MRYRYRGERGQLNKQAGSHIKMDVAICKVKTIVGVSPVVVLDSPLLHAHDAGAAVNVQVRSSHRV